MESESADNAQSGLQPSSKSANHQIENPTSVVQVTKNSELNCLQLTKVKVALLS